MDVRLKNGLRSIFRHFLGLRDFNAFFRRSFVIPKTRRKFGSFADSAVVQTPAFFTDPSKVFLEADVLIRPGFNLINHTGSLIVRRWSVIGPGCWVITGNHVRNIGVAFRQSITGHLNDREGDVEIGEDAWIGANCTLLCGAKLGRGSIVGACSMVNSEILPYTVAYGTPAKARKMSLSKEEIIEHEKALYEPDERLTESEIDRIIMAVEAGKSAVKGNL